jgi:hypothetical protein
VSDSTKEKVRVADEDFVRAYISVKSYEELATVLGLEVASVQARATKLRKAGVPLPSYERKKKEIDVAGLTALIAGNS